MDRRGHDLRQSSKTIPHPSPRISSMTYLVLGLARLLLSSEYVATPQSRRTVVESRVGRFSPGKRNERSPGTLQGFDDHRCGQFVVAGPRLWSHRTISLRFLQPPTVKPSSPWSIRVLRLPQRFGKLPGSAGAVGQFRGAETSPTSALGP